jgi:hypothetical protein
VNRTSCGNCQCHRSEGNDGLVLSNVSGALDEFKGTGYLTPDLMYGLFLLDMSGVVLLASNVLIVDMTEGFLRRRVEVLY